MVLSTTGILTAILAATSVAAPAQDVWQPLRFLVGSWRGVGKGEPGVSSVERTCEFVLNARYIHCRNSSEWVPTEKNPKGEHHQDWGFISFDKARKQFVLRQFHVEGFVNQYTARAVGPSMIDFETEAIENIPAGWRARERWRIVSGDEFVESFELAPPGKDFAPYSEIRFKRQ